MTKLTLGTAKIIKGKTAYILIYMNHGSFLQGERLCDSLNEAVEFCGERGLRIIETADAR